MKHIHMYLQYSRVSDHSVDEEYFDNLSAEPINRFLIAGTVTICSTVLVSSQSTLFFKSQALPFQLRALKLVHT